jgi:PAS domain S-box-containing protein
MADQKRSAPKRTENAREKSPEGTIWGELELYRTIAEHIAEGVSIVVGDQQVYVNPAYLRIHGLTDASQAIGKSMGMFMDADSLKTMQKARELRLQGEKAPATFEYQIQRPDGEQRVLEVTPAAITYEGKPATLALIRDVTVRTRNMEQLQIGNVIAENMAEGVSVAVGTERVYVNKAFAEIHGLEDESEAIGQRIDQFIVSEDSERVLDMWLAMQRGEEVPDRLEYRIRRVNDEERVVEASTAIIAYQGQRAVLAIIRDITDRKLAEGQLAQSVELYQALFDRVPVGIGIADIEGNLITFNDSMLQPGGYTAEDILRIGNVAHLYADPQERAESLQLAREQGYLFHHVVQFKRKDGGTYDASLSLSPVTINGKQCWQAMVEDITETRQVTAALEQSEELYRSVAENMTNGVSIAANGIRLYANQAFLDIHGLQRVSDAVGKGIGSFFTAEYQQSVLERQKTLEAGGGNSQSIGRQILRPDGQIRDIEVVTTAITYRNKPSFLSLYLDVTDRKRAEEEIMTSRQQAAGSRQQAAGSRQQAAGCWGSGRAEGHTTKLGASGEAVRHWSIGCGCCP